MVCNKVVLFLLLAFTSLSVAQWSGCVDPANPTAKLTKGDPTVVCLVLGPDGDWGAGVSYIRYSFAPEADEYTKYTIPNSYNDLVKTSAAFADNITVHSASQSSVSFLRQYYDSVNGLIYPWLTAIIDVKDGVVKGITWDDGCVFCSSSSCRENTLNFGGKHVGRDTIKGPSKGCFIDTRHCDDIMAQGGTQCDVTLFVVWTGTDENGKVLESSHLRFSAFPPSKVQDQVNDNLPELPSLPDLSFPNWGGGEDNN